MSKQFCTQCGTVVESNDRFCTSCGSAVSATSARESPPHQTRSRWQHPKGLLILIVGVAITILAIILYQSTPPSVVDVPDEHDASGLPYPNIPRISATDTNERLDNGLTVIVDVRSSQEYAEAHIPTARSIPLDELQLRYQELSPSAEIITYCT